MPRTVSIDLWIILLLVINPAVDLFAENNTLTEREIREGWQLLFDGSTTAGWRGYNMQAMPVGWSVENGCLTTSGEGSDLGGDIITNSVFEDFELCLEWAISKGGNSGVFYHVLEGDYPAAYATGPEYQLIDDVGFPQQLKNWQTTGADYAMYAPDLSSKVLKPAGEFNSSRIRVKDGHVNYWLNDKIVVECDLWSDDWYNRVSGGKWKDYPDYGLARKGHIGLQDHGSRIYFRNIKVRDLTENGTTLFIKGKEKGPAGIVHGDGIWKEVNGMLVGKSGPGGGYSYLATEKDYRDFLLRMEFKLESDGNSGVFFRSTLDGTDITGWQVEVAPLGEDTGGIYESGGRGWLAEIPDEMEGILKPDDWNDLVILVQGDRVMSWLNSRMMTDLRDEKIGEGEGVIALQVHSGGEVAVTWKNIFIRTL